MSLYWCYCREEEAWGDDDDLPFSFPSFFIDEDVSIADSGSIFILVNAVNAFYSVH